MLIEIIKNINLIIVGVVGVTMLILGSTVILSNRHSITNRTFFFLTISIISWSFFNYLSFQSSEPSIVLWILRLVMFSAVWFAFFVFRFLYVLPNEKVIFPKIYRIVIIPAVILVAILTLTPYVFSNIVEFSPDGTVAKVANGPAIILFGIVVIALNGSGVFYLIKKMIGAVDKKEKIRYQLVFVGMIATILLIIVFNFIFPAFFNQSRYIALATLFTFPFVAFTAYAIVKYKLLNIKVIATELLTFAIWIAVLIDLLLSKETGDRIFEGGLLVFIVIFGVLLIRSVRKEVSQREYLEVITKELESANEKLKELDDLKTDFISIASHQLRTPLTAIKGYTSMIMEGTYGEVSEKVRETIRKVFQSAQRLIYIVNDLLDISRIEQGRFTIALEPIKVANVLKDVVEELQQNAKTKNLSLELAVAPENMEVTASADFNKIRQVFLNVIDNAIKYTNEGYVKVGVEKRANDVFVAVKDSGLGISEASMKNLFQKFSRAKGVTKLHTDGSGLGLFIVKKIMEAHGGDVWAESEGEGKGSQFYVSIPLQRG